MGRFNYTWDDSELWTDFETSLERVINNNLLSEIIGENPLNSVFDNFGDRDWYDAKIYIENDCDELLEIVRSGFEDWISSSGISKVKKEY